MLNLADLPLDIDSENESLHGEPSEDFGTEMNESIGKYFPLYPNTVGFNRYLASLSLNFTYI
jgi:hypothetical protein